MAESEIETPPRRVGPADAPAWRKSSYSNSKGNCVEFAVLTNGRVAVRDSTRPAAGVLVAPSRTIGALVRSARRGRLATG